MEIFGVINASPDSLAEFSIVHDFDSALAYGQQLLADGADHLDLGSQASHGDAAQVSWEQELSLIHISEPTRPY